MWFTLVCWPSAQTLEHGMRELKWFIEAKPGSNQKPGIPIAGVNNGPQELLQAAFKNLKSPTGRIELTLRCFRVWHLGHVVFWSARNKIGCNNRNVDMLIFNEWSSMPVEIHAISWLSELSGLFCSCLQWFWVTSVTPISNLQSRAPR